MRVAPCVFTAAALVAGWCDAAAAATMVGEVSRTPPSVFAEHLAPLLTKLEDVLPGRTAFDRNETGGTILLAETIHYRDGDGTFYRLDHLVYHATDESAVDGLANDTFSFDRERESIFLVDAATIDPDGRRQPVEAKGAFIQTPQYEAQNSLYTSEAELSIVFPNVRPGACTEMIVLKRENVAVMPGEFTTVRSFAAGWPTYLERFVVDLPAAQWPGVHAHANQVGVPEPTIEAYAADRERRVWTKRMTPRSPREERTPSLAFRTPTLRLSTLESWDEVAAWFHGLVANRSALGPELEAEVDTWTDGLTDWRRIVDVLHEKVANDVRYTGLEFGLAGYQPYPCEQVWKNRYGDCKDKANLLRALLAHKGVRAHVTLLQTSASGQVEKASPSWKQFNHAILAVEDPAGGGYLFCDPTVKHLPAGTLGMSDLARDVLVVREGRADWARTPDALAAAIRVTAELALGPDGELSGWFTLGSEGSDAAYYAAHFNQRDADGRRRSMQGYAEDFFPGAEVMDVDYTPVEGTVGAHRIRCYFVRPSRAAAGEALRFPYPADWAPAVNTVGDRLFPYNTIRRVESVDVSIALPKGWDVRSLPSAFLAPSDAARFEATWSANDGHLLARLSWQPERAILAAGDYAVFQRSVRALRAWLEQPAVIAHGAGSPAPAANASATTTTDVDALRGFPVLATGEGQLRLLDERFPARDKPAERRAALEKVLQWFPNDAETVFTAQVKLALLDWDDDSDRGFAETMASLLSRYGAQMAAETRVWGEYLEARARWDADKSPAALERLRGHAQDESLSAYRRCWSAYYAGRAMAETDRAAALEFLGRFADLDSEVRDEIVNFMASTWAKADDAAGLARWAAAFGGRHGAKGDAAVAAALATAAKEWEKRPGAAQDSLLAALVAAFPEAAGLPKTAAELSRLRARATGGEVRAAFAREISAWLEAHPPKWWTRGKDARFAGVDEVLKEISTQNDAKNVEKLTDAFLQLALHHEPDFATFAKYLRWALWWMNDRKLEDELLETMGRLTLDMPPGLSHEIIGSWTQLGQSRARRGEAAAGRALFERVLACKEAQDHQRVEAGGQLGLLDLRGGRVDEALASFRRIEPIHTENKWGVDYLFVGLLVHLERGEFDRGLELVAAIRQQQQKYIDGADYNHCLKMLLRAAGDPATLRRYWERRTRWRPAWNKILADVGVPAPALHEPPLMTDLNAVIKSLDKARGARDRVRFLRELDTLARLGQWIPDLADDFVRRVTSVGSTFPLLRKPLYECALAMVGDLEPVDPGFDAMGRGWEATLLHDLGRKPEAATTAKALYGDLGPSDSTGTWALRIWVMATRDAPGEAGARAAVLAALAGEKPVESRTHTVRTLSDSYMLKGEKEAQRELLERETARVDFEASSENGKVLMERLKGLRSAPAPARGLVGVMGAALEALGEEAVTAPMLTRAFEQWRSGQDLAWLEHVPPASLAEPRFAGFKEPRENEEAGITTAERIKFNLLFALDERHSRDGRETAFREVVWETAWSTGDARRLAAMMTQASEIRELRSKTRGAMVGTAASFLLRNGERELAERMVGLPAARNLSANFRGSIEGGLRALTLAEGGAEGWGAAAFAALTDRPVDFLRSALVESLLRRLVHHGAAAEAEALVANSGSLATDPEWGQTPAAARLAWLRAVREAKESVEFAHAVRDRLNALPETPAEMPPEARAWFMPNDLSGLDGRQSLAFVVDGFRSGRWRPAAIPVLINGLRRDWDMRKAHPELGPALLALALDGTQADASRAMWVSGCSSLCDVDLPEIRATTVQTLEQFLASPAARNLAKTRQQAAHLRAFIALRTSTEARPMAIFEGLDSSGLPDATKTGIRLHFHFTRGQRDEALSALDAMDPSALTDLNLFRMARALLRHAGRDAEAQLIEEAMRARLQGTAPDLWQQPGDPTVRWWVRCAVDLGAAEFLPPAWFERAVALSKLETERAELASARARLQGDWAAWRAALDRELELVPDLYENFGERALARHHLGDLDGARADLRVFLRYCRDSADYPDRLALFRELAPGEEPAAP